MAEKKFWADAPAPKRAYRFVLRLAGIDQWVITKVNRPSLTVSETQHQYLNHTFYYPGRVEYNTVTFTMVDPLTPNSTGYALALISQSGYTLPATKNFETISKAEAIKALNTPQIVTINDQGDDVESFQLINAWVKNIELGEFDYGSEDLVNISVEMRYDFVKYEVKEGSIGNAVLNSSLGVFRPGN
tara:strand:+ start:632 stop:1192 length:561 start_codon:yes stop_codon:yes gene_type:complete